MIMQEIVAMKINHRRELEEIVCHDESNYLFSSFNTQIIGDLDHSYKVLVTVSLAVMIEGKFDL